MTPIAILYLTIVLINLYACPAASWRLASLIMEEKGPFDLFIKVRAFLGVPEDIDDRNEGNFWTHLLGCTYCTSMWTGTFTFLLAISGIGMVALMPLAISTRTILLDKKIND